MPPGASPSASYRNMATLDFTKNADGLVPAVIQDAATGKVLMLGYMNTEAWEKTRSTGLVTFWSRSRKQLWVKGETSGNYLHVVETYVDCDADTVLVKARPDGPTCHRGTVSCFDTPAEEGFLGALEQVIQGPNGSFAYPAVNSETRVINVTVRDGICYANLSSEFLTDSNGVTPQTTIYSIVNSLCELPSVEAVQISVDGQTDITFRETISLTGNFRMNPGIVEGQSEKDSDNK